MEMKPAIHPVGRGGTDYLFVVGSTYMGVLVLMLGHCIAHVLRQCVVGFHVGLLVPCGL
jgi:hypothetical protein